MADNTQEQKAIQDAIIEKKKAVGKSWIGYQC